MAIQLIVGQGVMHNRIFLRKCARWSIRSAFSVGDTTFQWLIRQFEERMIVLSDTGFHAAEGDPANLKLVKQEVRCHDDAPFHGDERRLFYRIHSLSNYPLDRGTASGRRPQRRSQLLLS